MKLKGSTIVLLILCTIGLLSDVRKMINGTAQIHNYVLFVLILLALTYNLYAFYQEGEKKKTLV
ncbi:hypothetical protein E0M25_21425 [Bacillus mycoides]|uniref:hypothetical protein n=1 Tax=Bacillus cereus group TaxID=86661 RepID=UPI001039F011|nr:MULTISPECIES: hypothetical protein [Bacillus cereus group]TBX73222.1 hypothetical protein E0M25_21425 [Bacillus mycoides]WJE23386.1 hypothetical protein QRE65_02885 [Bacillus cereus]